MKQYSLVGLDGNAFSIMNYVKKAMQETKFSRDEINTYLQEAQSKDYNHLLAVSCAVIDNCNEKRGA